MREVGKGGEGHVTKMFKQFYVLFDCGWCLTMSVGFAGITLVDGYPFNKDNARTHNT
jgi:hypothetical protein